MPEIQRTSLLQAVLQLKALPASLNINVLTFPFIDPPTRASMEEALRQLYVLEALDENGGLTEVGRAMAALPLDPSLARAVLAGAKLGYGRHSWCRFFIEMDRALSVMTYVVF